MIHPNCDHVCSGNCRRVGCNCVCGEFHIYELPKENPNKRKRNQTSFKKGHKFLGDLSKPNYFKKGERPSPETEFKKGHSLFLGEKHPGWKGAHVKYGALHAWIRRQRGTPKMCEHCGTTTAKRYEWANVDHKYLRRLEDFIRLCKVCHHKYDRQKN